MGIEGVVGCCSFTLDRSWEVVSDTLFHHFAMEGEEKKQQLVLSHRVAARSQTDLLLDKSCSYTSHIFSQSSFTSRGAALVVNQFDMTAERSERRILIPDTEFKTLNIYYQGDGSLICICTLKYVVFKKPF